MQSHKVINMIRQQLSRSNIKNVSSKSVFLFDCDGVLWKGSQPIEKAADTIRFLKSMGKRVFYVTNNSTRSRSEMNKKLQSMGFPSLTSEIITSAYAAALYLKEENRLGKAYIIGEQGIHEEMQAVSIPCCGKEDTDEKEVSSLARMDSEVETVIVGLDRDINYIKLSRAAGYIRDRKCFFLATNTDNAFPNAGGILSGGSGCLVSAVSTICSHSPDVIIGKPSSTFIDIILRQESGIRREDIIMVGDRLDTDVAFANQNMIDSICVLSGISTEQMIRDCDDSIAPQFYCKSIASIMHLMKEGSQ